MFSKGSWPSFAWLASLLTVIFLSLSGCGFGSKSDEDYYQEALQHYEQKNNQAAIIQLKNALSENLNHADSRKLLGMIYVEQGNGADAEKELRQALALGIPFEQVAILLGDALLQQGKTDELIETLQPQASDSDNLRATKALMIGEAYLQQGTYKEAKKHLQAATENDAAKPRALLGLALIAIIEREPEEAQKYVKQSLALDNMSPKAWLTQGDINRVLGEQQEAISAYQKAAETTRSSQSYFYQMAMRQIIEIQLSTGQLDAAEETLNTLKKSFYQEQFPGDIKLTYLRAVLAFQKQNFAEASELADKVLLMDKNHLGAKLLAGTADAATGNYRKAAKNLRNYLLHNPNNHQARKVLAFVQANNREYEEAIDTLAPITESGIELDKATLGIIATSALGTGDLEKSTKYLSEALELDPSNNNLRYSLAQSFLAQGDFDRAIEELSTLESADDQQQRPKIAKAKVYINAKDYDNAQATLEPLTKEYPDDPEVASLLGTVHYLKGDIENAREQFQQAIEIDQSYLPAIRSLAYLAIMDGDSAQAESVYQSALKTNPDNPNLLVDLGQLLMQQRRFDEAENLFKQAKDKEGSQITASVFLAQIYIAEKKPDLAKAELTPLTSTASPSVFAELGNAQMLSGEYANALASYKKLADLTPKSPIAPYLVSTAHIGLGNQNSADLALSRSLSISKTFAPALLAKARLALRNKDLKQAKQLFGTLKTTAPEQITTRLLEADIAMADNQPGSAYQIYQKIYAENPSNNLLPKMVQALWQAEGADAVIPRLKEITAKDTQNVAAYSLLASAYLESDNVPEAVTTYKKVIELSPNNAIALNNLAWLLKDSDPRQAMSYVERALEIEPDSEAIKDTLEQIKKSTP